MREIFFCKNFFPRYIIRKKVWSTEGDSQMILNEKIHAIFRALVENIASGKYVVGQRLPTDKILAESFGTSRINVFRALEQLKKLGLISSRKRAGTIVIAIPDAELTQQLLNDSSREVYCLVSRNPKYIHWDNETLAVLEKRLSREHLLVRYLTLPDKREDFARIIADSMQLGAAGLIIFPDSDDSEFLDENSDLLVDISTPIIMLNRGNDISRLDFISSVNIDVMGDAIHMGVVLRKNGFKRMIVPGAKYFNEKNGWCRTRITGLQLGFRGEGISEPELPETESENFESHLMRATADKELVLAAIHPYFAQKIIDTAAGKGLTPGVDFNLVSFDDNPEFIDCQLTTTRVNKTALGDIISKLFVNICRHPDDFVWDAIRVSSVIVQRTSCRALNL